jgi:uncharacterized protein (DUF433 family)
MELSDSLTEVPFGEIRVTGHCIGLYHFIEDYSRGYSPERSHEEFPTPSLDLIRKVLDFYHANRDAVDTYMARCRQESERRRYDGKAVHWEDLPLRRRDTKGRSRSAPRTTERP